MLRQATAKKNDANANTWNLQLVLPINKSTTNIPIAEIIKRLTIIPDEGQKYSAAGPKPPARKVIAVLTDSRRFRPDNCLDVSLYPRKERATNRQATRTSPITTRLLIFSRGLCEGQRRRTEKPSQSASAGT